MSQKTYENRYTDYKHKGIDQLKFIIDCLKDPEKRYSRRLIMSAWNPCQITEMALPPCHILCQFNLNPRADLVQFQSCMDEFKQRLVTDPSLSSLVDKSEDFKEYQNSAMEVNSATGSIVIKEILNYFLRDSATPKIKKILPKYMLDS